MKELQDGGCFRPLLFPLGKSGDTIEVSLVIDLDPVLAALKILLYTPRQEEGIITQDNTSLKVFYGIDAEKE